MILTISSEFYKARLDLIFVMLVFGYFFFLTSFVLLFMMPNIVGFVVFSVKKKKIEPLSVPLMRDSSPNNKGFFIFFAYSRWFFLSQ